MPAMGSALFTNQYLAVNEYIVASDGSHFAIMQGDGNFCVYRGSSPSSQGAFVWGSVQAAGYSPANGSYFVIMQADGNLCGYRGTGPNEQGAFLWGSVQLGKYPAQAGQYSAQFQANGSLSVYRKGTAAPLFSTTAG